MECASCASRQCVKQPFSIPFCVACSGLKQSLGLDKVFTTDVSLMLDIYDLQSRGQMGNISSIGLKYGVPHSTMLRHMVALEEKGWIRRIRSDDDERVVHINLTAEKLGEFNALFHPSMFE